jgi:hypothetical protein
VCTSAPTQGSDNEAKSFDVTAPEPPPRPASALQTWVSLGDAAKNESFSGFGGYWWLYGSTTVFSFQGSWRQDELRWADITSLEKDELG